jgi:hypothetical protein
MTQDLRVGSNLHLYMIAFGAVTFGNATAPFSEVYPLQIFLPKVIYHPLGVLQIEKPSSDDALKTISPWPQVAADSRDIGWLGMALWL